MTPPSGACGTTGAGEEGEAGAGANATSGLAVTCGMAVGALGGIHVGGEGTSMGGEDVDAVAGTAAIGGGLGPDGCELKTSATTAGATDSMPVALEEVALEEVRTGGLAWT